jgi:VCBS repeat-containing protein
MRRRTLQWCVISLLLTSCGGGQDNRPPAASAQSLTTAEDTIATGTLLGVDPDNDLLTYSIASQAAHGTASVQASGAFQYQPSANFNGSDSFEFQVTDPSGASAQAAVSITVTPVNDPPTLPPATFNGVQNQDITGKAAGSDVDGDTLMYAVAANPAHGTLVSFDSQGNFTYRPNAGYHGSDSFSASVTDPSGASNTGVLTLRVDGPPQANNDLISVPAGGPAVVDVLANDADPESDPLTVQIVASPTTGTASVTADNRVSLSLPNGFRGFTRFSYRAMDPNGLSSTATAVVFVGTPVARLAWIGDEFTPGTSDIVVSDFIGTSAADAPLPPGDTLSPFSVLYRPDSDQPALGFSTSLGGTYWATLDKPGSAKLITSGAQVTDIDVHSRFALYQSGDLLSLAALDGSAGTAVLNPPNYCGGAFGPAGADVFLGCTPPVNSFTPSTAYWLQVAAPGVVTPLAPATDPSNGPNAPIITPDGSAIVYGATRTDSSGTFHALFMVRISAPGQEIQISSRFTTLNEGAGGSLRFTPDGKKMIFSGFSTSNPGFCDLYVYDLANGGTPALINGPHASASCPIQYDISPDSQRVLYVLPPLGQPTQAALYETPLASPGTVNTVFAGGLGLYSDVRYDESGTDIIWLGSSPATAPQVVYEWRRSDGSNVQLTPAGELVESFAHNADWTIIAYTANRNGGLVYDQCVLNRAVPGQALQLSNPARTSGVLVNGIYYASAYFITK